MPNKPAPIVSGN